MPDTDDFPPGADDTVVGGPAPVREPAPGPAGPRFADRVWSFRAMLAVAVASLVIGGGIGSAVAAVSGDDDQDERGRVGRFVDGPRGGPGEGGRGQRFKGGPGTPEDLKELRKEMREEMREELQEMRRELKESREDSESGSEEEPMDPTPSPETPG